MPEQRRFQDRVALITGGGSGLGRAAAVRLAAEGADIAVADIREDGAAETRALVEEQGRRGLVVQCDVTSAQDMERAVAETVAAFGRLDVLFPSAGIGASGTVESTTEEKWDQVVNLDLKGVFLACKYAIPEIRKTGGGAIVTVASIGGMQGNSGAAFAAAKAGVVNLTRSMAVAHARENIRVNCICPGWIPTPINRNCWQDPERRAQIEQMHPMGRMGTPEEIAAAVAFLASDDASWITGAVLPVDGGYLATGRSPRRGP
ncbi:MAG: SDR family oxidoreductase [Kiritimatiellae bacterium]|nr:SDR family oxidoreductase [Kiritimatiellia bacterium]